MRRLLAMAAVSMVLSGCYTYRPAEYLAVQIGAPLVVVIIDEAVVPLAGKVRETWLPRSMPPIVQQPIISPRMQSLTA